MQKHKYYIGDCVILKDEYEHATITAMLRDKNDIPYYNVRMNSTYSTAKPIFYFDIFNEKIYEKDIKRKCEHDDRRTY